MGRAPRIYLAGPEVFLPDALAIGARKRALCAQYGFEGLFPYAADAPSDDTVAHDLAIYRACVALLRGADLAILNLTPFRGPSADVGTAVEFGMLLALGKPVFGYTNDPDDLIDRVRRVEAASYDAAGGVWRDAAGMAIEDHAHADNLMIAAALADAGHPIVRHAAAPAERFRDLTAFEACLRLAARERG
jgi:nucleoside 2-deoxyribosyltransferase